MGAVLTGTVAGPVLLRTPDGDEFLVSSAPAGNGAFAVFRRMNSVPGA